MVCIETSHGLDDVQSLVASFVYLPPFKLLLCREHRTCIRLTQLDRHLRLDHHLSGTRKAQLREAVLLLGPLTESPTIDQNLYPYIPHLGPDVPVKGWKCTITDTECDPEVPGVKCVSSTIDQAKRHRSKIHPVEGNCHKGLDGIDPVHIQHLFPLQCSLPFPVDYPGNGIQDPAIPSDDPAKAFCELRANLHDQSLERQTRRIANAAHQYDLTPWLRETRFTSHVAGYDVERLVRSYRHPSQGTDLIPHVLGATDRVLRRAVQLTSRNCPGSEISLLNAQVLATFDASGSISPQPFRSLQEPTTVDKYIREWKWLLTYVVIEGFINGGYSARSDASHTQTPCQLTQDQGDIISEMETLAQSDGSAGQWDDLVLDLSMALLDQPIPNSAYESAMVSFCAVRALRIRQSFATAAQFSPTLSAILKCAQFFIYAAAKRRAGDSDPTGPLRHLCTENLLCDKSKPFPLLFSWRLFGMSIGRNQVPMPRLTWNADSTAVTYAAKRLRLDDLRSGLRQSVDGIRKQLYQGLLFSIRIPGIDLESLVDSLPDDTPGYWFARDPRNDLHSKRRWLLEQAYSNASLREKFLVQIGGGLGWNVSRATQYLSDVQTFLQELLALIHITGGQPNRGKELLIIRLWNTIIHRNVFMWNSVICIATQYHKRSWSSGSKPRCHFLPAPLSQILVDFLILVKPFADLLQSEVSGTHADTCRDGRSDSSDGPSDAPPSCTRPPAAGAEPDEEEEGGEECVGDDENQTDDDESELDALAGLHVTDASENPAPQSGKAFERSHQQRDAAGPPSPTGRGDFGSGDLCLEFLFQSGNSVWKGPVLKQALQRFFTIFTFCGIGVQVWRQMAIGIYRKNLVDTGDMSLDEDNNLVCPNADDIHHLQASHSASAGNLHYGNQMNLIGGLTDDAMHRFHICSYGWWRFLGLVPQTQHDPCRPLTPSLGRCVKRRPSSPADNHCGHSLSPQSKKSKAAAVKDPVSTLGVTFAQTMYYVEDFLRHLYGSSATLRANGQCQAMEAIIARRTKQLFVVLPTGSGKTLLYVLPSMASTMVVNFIVVPLIALQNNLLDECHALNIPVTVWTSSMPGVISTSPLVLVSVESAISQQFQGEILALESRGQLGRIFLDEVHTVLTASSYRECFHQLHKLRRTNAPIVCLSATLPAAAVNEIAIRLDMTTPALAGGDDNIQVVRRSTDRPELQYNVQFLSTSDMESTNMFEHLALGIQRASITQSLEDRGIVFAGTISNCHAAVDFLRSKKVLAAAYHGKMDKVERREIICRWKAGEIQVLVGTLALGCAMHYSSVRWIFWLYRESSAIEFAQQAGRAGRDGKRATCTILLPGGASGWQRPWPQQTPDTPASSDPQPFNADLQAQKRLDKLVEEDAAVMREFVATTRCRRAVITEYLDGLAEACWPQAADTLCDNCLGAALGTATPHASSSLERHPTMSSESTPCRESDGMPTRPLWSRDFQPSPDLSGVFRASSATLPSTLTARTPSSVLASSPPAGSGPAPPSPELPRGPPRTRLSPTSHHTPPPPCRPRPSPWRSSSWTGMRDASGAPMVPDSCPPTSSTLPTPSQTPIRLFSQPTIAETRVQNDQQNRDRYVRLLHLWRDRCFFCSDAYGTPHIYHRGAPCPAADARDEYLKWRLSESRFKFARFIGCYCCGQPQWLCVYGGVRREYGKCQFRDMIMEMCVTRWEKDETWRQSGHRVVTNLSGAISREQLWKWLSKKCRLWGEDASNAALMASEILFRADYDANTID